MAIFAWLALVPPAHADPSAPFTSPQSVADLVPEGIHLKNGDDWDLTAVAQANAAVAPARGQPATFRIRVESTSVSGPGHGGGYNLHIRDGQVDIHGTTILYRFWIYTSADQSAAAAKIEPGSTVTVSGTLDRSDIKIYSLNRVFLCCVLNNAKIVGAEASASVPPSPTQATPPVAPAVPPRVAEQAGLAPDKPIINSLGVKFVPAGTADVLFSVWDVRVKDFQAYVNATGYQAHGDVWSLRNGVYKRRPDTWNSPGFTQTENDPVVGVDGDEANAFCQWLTRKERTEGSLPPNQAYRLPTKAEWSAAAGSTQYSWGNEWPPPPGAGNFAGSEARNADWPPGDPTIDGYNDGFPRTSPVGSFSPNQYGLYDMGGNVHQMCQDEDGTWTTCGSGWQGGTAEMLRLDQRFRCSRPSRAVGLGFRLVLAVSTKVAAANPLSPVNPVPAPVIAPTLVTPAIPQQNSPIVNLTQDQARAVVVIKGDNAEGTGFLVKTKDGPVVVTNQHVIANNPNLKIMTNTGEELTILSYKGATDRDLAMIAIKDGAYSYLTLATDVSGTVQPGDEVITPGNSQGGDVVLNTDGKVLGLGPDRVEFDNPVYHGNSGGPVFDVKTGQVIGVVTEAVKVDVSNELDKASFANRNSAISRTMRYFGLRLDTVPAWEPIDWRQYLGETAFLDAFDLRSRALDSFLNAPNDNKPEDTVWKQDDKIVKANNGFFSEIAGADTGQQMDAVRQLYSDLHDIANTDAATIANPSNFYTYDRQRAKDEIAYRKALQAELDQVDKDVSRLSSLPRTNQ